MRLCVCAWEDEWRMQQYAPGFTQASAHPAHSASAFSPHGPRGPSTPTAPATYSPTHLRRRLQLHLSGRGPWVCHREGGSRNALGRAAHQGLQGEGAHCGAGRDGDSCVQGTKHRVHISSGSPLGVALLEACAGEGRDEMREGGVWVR